MKLILIKDISLMKIVVMKKEHRYYQLLINDQNQI